MNHLTIDAGNSQLVLVTYKGEERIESLRIRTHHHSSPEEIAVACRQILQDSQFSPDEIHLTISSVVPLLEKSLREVSKLLGSRSFHWIDWNSPHGFEASESARKEIGADLISGLVGARQFSGEPFVVIDCGTATTLTLVNENNYIMGVAILPGLATQMLSLTQSAPHLPQEVSLRPPRQPFGNDTEEALQSGILYGHAASIEGFLTRYRSLFPQHKLTALGCGGLFHRISPLCTSIDHEEMELVNIGCRLLAERLASSQEAL